MNINLLKSKMALNDCNSQGIADLLNISKSSASLRVRGIREFSLDEIKTLKDTFNLEDSEVIQIFFN